MPTTDVKNRRYVRPNEAAEYARVSRKTIDRMIARGELPAYRINARIVRVDLNDVDALFTPIPTMDGGAA